MEPYTAGWYSSFDEFQNKDQNIVVQSLEEFVKNISKDQFISKEQIVAWEDSVPKLQWQARESINEYSAASKHTMILEYQMPMESKRPDVVVLRDGSVAVVEIKSKGKIDQADIDQVSAYARDLRSYHSECHEPNRKVHAILMLMGYEGPIRDLKTVSVCNPADLSSLVKGLETGPDISGPSLDAFLQPSSYCPLPTLVHAARELFDNGELRTIRKARAATDPAVALITSLIHEAARLRKRKLILLSGIPGAGKTLVGLQAVHAHFLDDLKEKGSKDVPAVFLSGNGPLVEVLQYELKSAGGGGKTFVRDVRNYRQRLMRSPNLVPSEHVVVFDEAQRAWDFEKMDRDNAGKDRGHVKGMSEPDYFIQFANRKPDWSVIVALVGSGQEIHDGEESGIQQWADAIAKANRSEDWTIHGPDNLLRAMETKTRVIANNNLHLSVEIRYHAAEKLSEFVASLLEGERSVPLQQLAETLELSSFNLKVTRDLDAAKSYLKTRYENNSFARYGLVASSRAKDLAEFGVRNSFQDTKTVKYGPWYGEDESSRLSCRQLKDVVTEFGCQGLELDASILAWGTDLIRINGKWSNRHASRYRSPIQDAFKLRINAYRVLLTRARDCVVVYLPYQLNELDETYDYLLNAGFTELKAE